MKFKLKYMYKIINQQTIADDVVKGIKYLLVLVLF